jgi:tRNA nucleotidyltransferase/poly(A) polymerase
LFRWGNKDKGIDKVYLYKFQQELFNIILSDKNLHNIVVRLSDSGYNIHLVGGCVRDAIIGRKFSDIDLVTNALPEEIKELFSDRDVDCQGKFLVAVVDGFEIATYRKDVHNTGLSTECEVERVKTLEEDLSRRDFTCNAIAFDPIVNTIIDSFLGVADLYDRKIKFVGDPDRRINEGFERIVRACRFQAVLDGYFSPSTLLALRENAHLIDKLPKEKIQLEVVKAMKLQKASLFFDALHLIGALRYIFPSLEACFDQDGGPYHAETVFTHCMEVGDSISTKNWRVKLAGYLHDVGKPPCAEISAETTALRFRNHPVEGAKLVTQELKKLKFSNESESYVSNLVLLHMTSLKDDFSKRAVKKFMVKLEEKQIDYRDWMRLLIADRKGNYKIKNYSFGEIRDRLRGIYSIFKEEKMFSLKDLVVDGRDVMEYANLESGPEIGMVLRVLFADCFETPEHNTREYLINQIHKFNLCNPKAGFGRGELK